MIRLRAAFALGIVLAAGAYVISFSAIAEQNNPPTVRQAVQVLVVEHHITVENLDRIGKEPATIPADSRSPYALLSRLLNNYDYVAIWGHDHRASNGGLPVKLVIIGKSGKHQDVASDEMSTGPAAAGGNPPTQSAINRKLTYRALVGAATAASPVEGRGDVTVHAPPPAPMTPEQMAPLTLTAMQQVRQLAVALTSIPAPSQKGAIPPAIPARSSYQVPDR